MDSIDPKYWRRRSSKVDLVGSLESWHKKTFNRDLIETLQKLNSPAACVARLQKISISVSLRIPPRTMLTADSLMD